MFKTILNQTTNGIYADKDILICIATALILGFVISLIYIFSDKKRRFSTNFAITLVILPAVVSVVIMLVGSNVARAFSMAGAFALIRFRSVPGDSKDITSVFFSMAVGLATGLGYIKLAIVITVIIGIVYFVLMISKYGVLKNNDKTLRITVPENLNFTGSFDDLFDTYTNSRSLDRIKTTNVGSLYELTYTVSLKKDTDEKKFIDEIRCRNGNLNIILCKTETPADLL